MDIAISKLAGVHSLTHTLTHTHTLIVSHTYIHTYIHIYCICIHTSLFYICTVNTNVHTYIITRTYYIHTVHTFPQYIHYSIRLKIKKNVLLVLWTSNTTYSLGSAPTWSRLQCHCCWRRHCSCMGWARCSAAISAALIWMNHIININIHTYIHTYIHIHIHTYIHIYIHYA